MDDSARREVLTGLISIAIAEHDQWAADPDHVYITARVDEAMSELIGVFEEGSIPGDCRELAKTVEAFGSEWVDWQAEVDRRGSAVIPPPESTWKAWEAVVDCYRGVVDPPRRPLESVATLRAQVVPDWQICEIYGWKDSRGNPETRKVEEELASPGKHTTGCVDPVTRKRQEAAERQKALAERVKRLRLQKVARMSSEAPESLAELIQQGVPLHQIAEMLRMSEEQILAECEAQKLPAPPSNPNVQAIVGQHEPEMSEPMARQFDAQESERDRQQTVQPADPPAVDSDLPLEQQIIQYHQHGFAAADIADALTTDDQKVSRQKVQAIVKRYEDDPAAMAMPTGN